MKIRTHTEIYPDVRTRREIIWRAARRERRKDQAFYANSDGKEKSICDLREKKRGKRGKTNEQDQKEKKTDCETKRARDRGRLTERES